MNNYSKIKENRTKAKMLAVVGLCREYTGVMKEY